MHYRAAFTGPVGTLPAGESSAQPEMTMGNRVVVVFTDGKGEYSPCVYLHWHTAKLEEFLIAWRERMKGRDGDVQYGAARFVGVCHERIAGNLSLGIWDSRITTELALGAFGALDAALRAHDPGDAGVVVVNVTDYTVRRLSTTAYAMMECPVPDGWKIPAAQPSKGAGAWFALPLLPHVGHDGGLHHSIPMLLAGLLLGWILLAVRRARRVRR